MADPRLVSEFLQAPSSLLFVLHLWDGAGQKKRGENSKMMDSIKSAESNKGHK